MRNFRSTTACLAIAMALGANAAAQEGGWNPLGGFHTRDGRPMPPPVRGDYIDAVMRTAAMVGDPAANQIVGRTGLRLLNLTWEDTGRYKNSSVGPNISDMTIQVALDDPRSRRMTVRSMPVIRYDNFSDKTADLDPDGFTLLVGNERSSRSPLRRVSLRQFLLEPTRYMSDPSSWSGRNRSLLADRDTKVLVSAQAAFLPVPMQGKATFNPVLFNYQSSARNPAVLTILATREGTSMTVIDNTRDAFREGSAWGQRLFFNQGGQRASLTGERLSDFKGTREGRQTTGADAGLNMVLLIQVPLKHRAVTRAAAPTMEAQGGLGGGGSLNKSKSSASDVEAAVIGHGDLEGPFTEVDHLAIERDERFPVRVTVQFYKATSNGIASAADVAQIRKEIDHVYSFGSSVGSLVVGGSTGRVTEYEGMKVQPRGWWDEFWRRHQRNTGDSPMVAMAKLRKLLGSDYMSRPVCGLYVTDLLRKS